MPDIKKKGLQEVVQVVIKWIKIPEAQPPRVWVGGDPGVGEFLGYFDLANGAPENLVGDLVDSLINQTLIQLTVEYGYDQSYGAADVTLPALVVLIPRIHTKVVP